MLEKILRDLKLLIESPKDYLYSIGYPNTEKVVLKKFDPKAYKAAQNLIRKLEKLSPEIKFYLIGSTALKIDGTGDIDLFATTELELQKVAAIYFDSIGNPNKIRRDFIRWDFKYENFSVEFFLNYPDNKHFQNQIRLFNLLKNNPTYLKEYDDLKKNINGCSVKEYIRQRMSFFNRILKDNKK